MECEYLHNGYCAMAKKIVNDNLDGYEIDCATTNEACEACFKTGAHKSINSVTVSLACSNVRKVNQKKGEYLTSRLKSYLKREVGVSHAVKYLESTARWVKEGSPKRNDSEVEDILKICESNKCGKYRVTANKSWCGSCGCSLSKGSAVVSKIRRATEHCPEGHW